ncbi:hypothetical protein ACAG96_08190 [Candidatus Izemoplasma sp. B36]|uniref:hypothetical protein n=1 Tax=Candidatus Izemoplasma sp. B36 TaxID=3242468 RepID=UPI00355797DC
MESKIKEKIQLINNLYQEKNIELLKKEYSKLFFDDSFILGTSQGEFCSNKEEIIKLFDNDFKYWGDFNIDIESLEYSSNNGFIFAKNKAYLEIEFNLKDTTYTNFVEEVNYINSKYEDIHKSASEISWVLTHILCDNEGNKRKYKWTFDFYSILSFHTNENLMFKAIQFAYPFRDSVYDLVLETEDYFDKLYQKDMLKLDQISFKNNLSNILNKNLNEAKGYVIEKDSYFAFCSIGSFDEKFKFEDFYSKIINEFNETKNVNDKLRLFRLNRDLNYAAYSESLGLRKIPFRIFGIGKRQDDKYNITDCVVTFPYLLILEGKGNDEIRILD